MGVDIYVMDFLLKFRGRQLGDTLCLGRQGFHVKNDELANSVLQTYDKSVSIKDISGSSGYCEDFFLYLGSKSVKSLDYSDFEGADIIHDLNFSVSSELDGRFDCIFDGGTIEHIYDFPTVISNVKRMLKVGGVFFMVDGANNFLGHGLYQFSPELLWRTFSRENGFEIELMQLVDDTGRPKPRDVPDPAVLGHRSNMLMSTARTYVVMAARKTLETHKAGNKVYQSDYVAAWQKSIKS